MSAEGPARLAAIDHARPLPRRSELGAPFWEAADRRELVRERRRAADPDRR